ncbi:D-2-hydroxyacid dehydrogenase [Fructobacillus tropaeoli]|uniref:D-2-hydroxyacid dehydrogenase n=1 Tax=Fructobacillus tropaeoli TaxID=709323 RepID=UPI00145626B3|nr:D-2-hydroxyacid dehydrogenase [Fructobacillus tropaeoli]NLS37798.1 D-2-hydroxyacid dehydrogenase [Fructobacillus tropaeoli]
MISVTKIVVLDGYELNHDLNWASLSALGQCTFYDRTDTKNNQEIIEHIGDAEIVITHKTPLNRDVLQAAGYLKYIGLMGTGYDVVDMHVAQQKQIIVTNVPSYASDAVAQFTFSLLLEVTGQVGLHNRLVHENQWSNGPDFTFWQKPLLELRGKTIGLIGFGHIAQKVAKLAHAFSMNVIFYNHRPKKVTESWLHQVDLVDLLKTADVISLHVIQTPDTIKMINSETLALMKPSAILLNTSRGKLVDEEAVATALNQRRLAAFATDVVSQEPIDMNNLLLTAENCFITPHIAWAPLETRERLLDITVENVQAYLNGRIQNQVKVEE